MPFSRLEKIQFLLLFFLLLEFILFHELLLFSQVTVHMFFWQTAETVNPCKGLQFPCHHAWLSRSSGLIEQFFSSLIPHTVFKFLYIILPSLFSLILPKSCSHHWASASHSSCLLGNVHPFLPNSPQYRGIKCTEQQKIVPGSYKAAIRLSEAADATAIPVPPDREQHWMWPTKHYLLGVAVCGTAKTGSCWSQQASGQQASSNTWKAKGYGIKLHLTPSLGIFPPGNVLLYYHSSYCISYHILTSYKGKGCKLSRLLIPYLIKLVLQILDIFCSSFPKNEFVLQIHRKQLTQIH